MAARALKAQAWRFHRQHQAWFQRHEEPKAGGQPGDDWEQGTYVYFDNLLHEGEAGAAPTGWCYRLKESFLFKYDALEDELA
jgi:CCR4-NOT transcription complex subunit 3